MARFRLAFLCCVVLFSASLLRAQVPPPDPTTRNLTLQTAMAEARELLQANQPTAAVEALEKALPFAEGDKSYLELLRTAYTAEMQSLQLRNADEKLLASVRTKLQLIPGGSPPNTETVSPATEALKQASQMFKQGKSEPNKFADAAKYFAAAFRKVEMTPEQLAAWAYCRVRVANDRLVKAGNDATVASEVLIEVEDALKLASTNGPLQKIGAEVLAAAKQQSVNQPSGVVPTKTNSEGWDSIETASFRVLFQGRREQAEAIGQTAEKRRGEIFTRWSNGNSTPWTIKCDIVLHPTANAFGQVTQQPVSSTGLATVQLNEAHVTSRRIDLRADDSTATTDALPRELTYVVLADLFPYKAPPRWAEVGMAVLSTSDIEQNRYSRTFARCVDTNSLIAVSALTQSKAPPADRVTEFYVESASLVSFFVKWKGEREFTTFLREAERYGFSGALTKHYGIKDVQQLETTWKKAALATARGQGE